MAGADLAGGDIMPAPLLPLPAASDGRGGGAGGEGLLAPSLMAASWPPPVPFLAAAALASVNGVDKPAR